jgi:hypothetical protein
MSAYHEIIFTNYAYQWELSCDCDPVTVMSNIRRLLFTAFPFQYSSTCWYQSLFLHVSYQSV